ncbi:helix-turn-helix transcriptional regulator [Halovenus sp. HT40]|uniref:helix-turn-helix transcriptional regulator n=1 Tax=Halovenus sp. HT40 TaxID=3126691 RepID=UPI00300EB391
MVPVDGKRLFAAVVFVGAVVVLSLQLINPSPVVIEVGENGSEVVEVGEHYSDRDVLVVALSACLVGISGTYLLTADPSKTDREPSEQVAARETVARTPVTPQVPSEETGEAIRHPSDNSTNGSADEGPAPSEQLLEVRKEEWEETADRLANKEQTVYEIVLEADGVLPQSEIVEQADLSKASVSRALDGLEAKQLVERKRRGMGNVIILQ